MEAIWQWAWGKYRSSYTWAVYLLSLPVLVAMYLFWSMLIVAVESSRNYVQAAVVTIVAVPILAYVIMLPGAGHGRIIDRWAAGDGVDAVQALNATYALSRGAVLRAVIFNAVWDAVLSAAVAAIAGATASRVVHYGILGGVLGLAIQFGGVHSFGEAALRPVRIDIAGDSDIGDNMPRSQPTFATWSSLFLLAAMFVFAVDGAMLASVFYEERGEPLVVLLVGCALAVVVGVPLNLGVAFAPTLQPIRDLARGTERVAAGDYSQRLPVVQDDDLGALSASFNRMQAGLVERQRLQTAFGTYVDPGLAARLLEQGDDVFTGEHREVTVMFVDVRDFTPFAELHSAEDTVARLNALFEIVVPAVVDAGGHVNKFLGDGALAVFGAPNDLTAHADQALSAATTILRLVAERFDGSLRIGIGINTGVVIAGTIGGGGKLEFTLIGDTVNVAARVEQLTKSTGDTILFTGQTASALTKRLPAIVDRGFHAIKGKAVDVQVFTLV